MHLTELPIKIQIVRLLVAALRKRISLAMSRRVKVFQARYRCSDGGPRLSLSQTWPLGILRRYARWAFFLAGRQGDVPEAAFHARMQGKRPIEWTTNKIELETSHQKSYLIYFMV